MIARVAVVSIEPPTIVIAFNIEDIQITVGVGDIVQSAIRTTAP